VALAEVFAALGVEGLFAVGVGFVGVVGPKSAAKLI
jgi:hypothetical protein